MEEPKPDKKSLMALMTFWLFGTFVIVFAAVTVYLGIYTSPGQALLKGLPIWGLTGILCVIWYFLYKWYLNRKK